jgi:hypothetical protein
MSPLPRRIRHFHGYLFSRPMAANALTEMIYTASPGAFTRHYERTIQAVATIEKN